MNSSRTMAPTRRQLREPRVVQFNSVAQLCLTLCDHMDCTTPGFPVLHYLLELLKLLSTESVMPSNHLILFRHLLLPSSIFPSTRVFSSESVLRIRWPKYWSFSFSTSPSIEYSGLISFRMNSLDLLTVQGALKSLLQHHSSKASVHGKYGETMGTVTDFIFLGSKITADDDCSHEIKRHLLL